MSNRLVTALCVLLCAIAAAAILHTAGQPIDYLKKDLVVDDAIYYVQPARHLVEGLGYSFDGVHRTNGVQPLWAIVVAGLAFLLRDPDAMLRGMVLLSGGCWLAGGCVAAWWSFPAGRARRVGSSFAVGSRAKCSAQASNWSAPALPVGGTAAAGVAKTAMQRPPAEVFANKDSASCGARS